MVSAAAESDPLTAVTSIGMENTIVVIIIVSTMVVMLMMKMMIISVSVSSVADYEPPFIDLTNEDDHPVETDICTLVLYPQADITRIME